MPPAVAPVMKIGQRTDVFYRVPVAGAFVVNIGELADIFYSVSYVVAVFLDICSAD
jgi:hypothetical protein